MRALGVSELLAVWERAYGQQPAQRALTLAVAVADEHALDPRALPVGERDALLLTLREATFGEAVSSVAACAACGEPLELHFCTGDVRAPPACNEFEPLSVDGYRVEWRLPTSAELAALSREEGLDAARLKLMEHCVLRASLDTRQVAPDDLPDTVQAALADAVAGADPQADVELAATCPACGHPNRIAFDVAAFFWEELNDWARRTLLDVHALASAYGWPEREVLAMSAFRRHVYLEMLGV